MNSLKRLFCFLMTAVFSWTCVANEPTFQQNLQHFIAHAPMKDHQVSFREFWNQYGTNVPADLRKDFQSVSNANPDLNVPVMKKVKFEKNGDLHYEMKVGNSSFVIVMNEAGFTITQDKTSPVHFDLKDAFNHEAFLQKIPMGKLPDKKQKKVSFIDLRWLELLISKALAAEGDRCLRAGYVGVIQNNVCQLNTVVPDRNNMILCNPTIFGGGKDVPNDTNATINCVNQTSDPRTVSAAVTDVYFNHLAEFNSLAQTVNDLCQGEAAKSSDCIAMQGRIQKLRDAKDDKSKDEPDNKGVVEPPPPPQSPPPPSESQHSGQLTKPGPSLLAMALPFLLVGAVAIGLYMLMRPRPPVIRNTYIYPTTYFGGTTTTPGGTTTPPATGGGVDGTGGTAPPNPGFGALFQKPNSTSNPAEGRP